MFFIKEKKIFYFFNKILKTAEVLASFKLFNFDSKHHAAEGQLPTIKNWVFFKFQRVAT